MGLKHLLYFAENHGRKFRELVDGQAAKPIQNQYPVCAVGINISQLLINLFGASKEDGKMEPGMPLIFPMLFLPNAYNELYCVIFELLDIKWTEMVNLLFFQLVLIDKLYNFLEFILYAISRRL